MGKLFLIQPLEIMRIGSFLTAFTQESDILLPISAVAVSMLNYSSDYFRVWLLADGQLPSNYQESQSPEFGLKDGKLIKIRKEIRL